MGIGVTQALFLDDYFRNKQREGEYKEYNFRGIKWIDITEQERKRIWALIYNDKKEDLIKMLRGLGLKG